MKDPRETKCCLRCKRERPSFMFPNARLVCQGCSDTLKSERQRGRQRPRNLTGYEYPIRERAIRLCHATRLRAWRFGVEFDLTPDWIAARLEAGRCEVTGLAFEMRGGLARNSLTPSIDRKIARLGYTQANCQMVVWIYNCAKGVGTHDDVMTLVRALSGEPVRPPVCQCRVLSPNMPMDQRCSACPIPPLRRRQPIQQVRSAASRKAWVSRKRMKATREQ